MGSGGRGGGYLDSVAMDLEYGVRDFGIGLEQIGQGQVSRGVGTLTAPTAQATGAAIGGPAGFALANELFPTNSKKEAYLDELNTSARIEEAGAQAFERNRKQQGINALLDELIRIRTTKPGRNQTLFSQGIVPNSMATGLFTKVSTAR